MYILIFFVCFKHLKFHLGHAHVVHFPLYSTKVKVNFYLSCSEILQSETIIKQKSGTP